MSAKELFEKLGYEIKYHINESKLIFIGYTQEDEKIEDCVILFNVPLKMFTSSMWIDKNLLQAINKQIEELGWLNE